MGKIRRKKNRLKADYLLIDSKDIDNFFDLLKDLNNTGAIEIETPQKNLKNIYIKYIEQEKLSFEKHWKSIPRGVEPVLVVKKNPSYELAILSLTFFLELVKTYLTYLKYKAWKQGQRVSEEDEQAFLEWLEFDDE